MTDPAPETPVSTDTNNTPTSDDSFISSIDSAFENLGSLDDVPEIETPVDEVVTDTDTDTDTPNGDTGGETDDDSDDSLDGIDDVDVADWSPEAAKAFKMVRNELKNERNHLKQLNETLEQRENRIKELEAVSPEVDALRQKIEEYESKLLVTRVEDTTAYKTLVEEPLREIITQSDTLAEKYSIDPEQLFTALTLEDEAQQEEAISEMLATASERDRFKAYQLIEQLKPVTAQRNALRENSQEALREIQELEQIRQREESARRLEHRKEVASKVSERVFSKLTFLKDIEGVDMKTLVKEAESTDHTTLPPVKAVYNQMAADLLPKVAREFIKITKERDALISKLAKYSKASPRVGGQTGDGGQTADPNLSFDEAVNRHFGG